MILLVLVVLWIVVLAPAFVKRCLEQRSTGSIDSFHHRLHLLERTGPKLVPPAYRLETAQSSTGLALGQSGFPTVSSMPGRPNLVLLQPVGDGDTGTEDEVVDEASGEHYRRLLPPAVVEPVPVAVPSTSHRVDDYHRRQVRRRRRDVLLGLLATCVLTALVGIVPSFHVLWVVTVLSGVGLAAYVGMAAYAQLLEADRYSAVTRPRRMDAYSYSSSVTAGPLGAASAGYPGAWDEDEHQDEVAGYYEEEYEESQPRRAVGGG